MAKFHLPPGSVRPVSRECFRNDWEKIIKIRIWHDTQMLHNIQISVCINKILPKHSHGICSHSVYDYFPATVPELRVVTDYRDRKLENLYDVAHKRKGLLSSDLESYVIYDKHSSSFWPLKQFSTATLSFCFFSSNVIYFLACTDVHSPFRKQTLKSVVSYSANIHPFAHQYIVVEYLNLGYLH